MKLHDNIVIIDKKVVKPEKRTNKSTEVHLRFELLLDCIFD